MPFKDLPAGTTHYQNDGCGEPEHNDKSTTPHDCAVCKGCEQQSNEYSIL